MRERNSDVSHGYTPLGAMTFTGIEPVPSEHHATGEWRFRSEYGIEARLAPLTKDILRLRLLQPGEEPARSWAVERTRWEAVDVVASQSADSAELGLAAYTVTASLDPFRVSLRWPDGTVFARHDSARGMGLISSPAQDVPPDPQLPAGGARCHLRLGPGERVIGAGERTDPFDRRGARITFWNTDPPHPHNAATGAMYTSIPFWMVARPDGRVWGVFMDSVARSDLDAGASDPEILSFGVVSGDLTMYLLAGPTPAAVLEQYTELTGRAPLPPRWALGYGQSRWSYFSDAQTREIAAQFRARSIPCDHLWLDIDYMDGYRVFTWNPTRYPNPAKLLADLSQQGFKVVTIIDPGVKADPTDPTFAGGVARDYFVRRPDGALFIGVVWPGESVFTDYTRDDARAWWGERHAALLDAGVAGIWDDMNEPALTDLLAPGAGAPHGTTMALDALHHPDGADGVPIPHQRLHNAYGLLMARATCEGLERLQPDTRPFVLSRSGYAGIQRYAATWTGDNNSRWDHLRLAARMCLSLGMSGAPFVGFDTGGFWGEPSGEMLTRFTQLGALFPLFRNHSAMDTSPQEPWALGQPFESFIRQAIELRYRLLPYLYTLVEEASRSGAPVTRPMLYHWPQDATVAGLDDQFTLGADLLAAPAFTDGERQRDVRFPQGAWRDWLTGRRYAGPGSARVECPIDVLPLYQREGSIIPLGPVMPFVGALDVEDLTLACALSADPLARASGALYQDDGATRAFERGSWRRVTYIIERDGDHITLQATSEGEYDVQRQPTSVELHLPRTDLAPATPDPVIRGASLDGRPLDLAATVTTERRRYETVLRVALGAQPTPFTLALTLANTAH